MELSQDDAKILGLSLAANADLFNKGTVKNAATIKRAVKSSTLRDTGLWKGGDVQNAPGRVWSFATALPLLKLQEASAADFAARVKKEKDDASASGVASVGGAK